MSQSPLSDVPGRPPPSRSEIATLSATLDVDADQTGVLRATLVLDHHGDAAIELLDPFGTLQWQLLDERGAPLELPRSVPAVFTRATPPRVLLEPGGQVSTTVEFPQLADGRPLAGGAYSLGVIAPLVDADATDGSRLLQAAPLPVTLSER
jgi:hypothetical protein